MPKSTEADRVMLLRIADVLGTTPSAFAAEPRRSERRSVSSSIEPAHIDELEKQLDGLPGPLARRIIAALRG